MGAREAIVRALLKGAPGGPHPSGIHVYHQSPHDIDRFDWSKIGTGEGGAAFTKGFYFAENPAVSGQGGQYWQQFKGRFSEPEIAAAEKLQSTGFDREAAIAAYQKRIDEMEALRKSGVLHPSVKGNYSDPVIIDSINKSLLRNLQEERDLLTRGAPVGPRTYEVNINARPDLMLDWDERLVAQPQVMEQLKTVQGLPRSVQNFLADPRPRATGKDLASELEWDIGREGPPQVLREAGIPGIRYLDQGSRSGQALQNQIRQYEALPETQFSKTRLEELRGRLAASPPTYNYVINDPSKLDILGKYGVVGTAGGGLGVLAAQDQYPEAQ